MTQNKDSVGAVAYLILGLVLLLIGGAFIGLFRRHMVSEGLGLAGYWIAGAGLIEGIASGIFLLGRATAGRRG